MFKSTKLALLHFFICYFYYDVTSIMDTTILLLIACMYMLRMHVCDWIQFFFVFLVKKKSLCVCVCVYKVVDLVHYKKHERLPKIKPPRSG